MSEKRPRGIVAADHLITIFCLLRQTSSSGHLLQPQRSLCSLAELLFSVLLLLHPTYSSPISRNIAQAPSPRYVPSAVRPMKLERSMTTVFPVLTTPCSHRFHWLLQPQAPCLLPPESCELGRGLQWFGKELEHIP